MKNLIMDYDAFSVWRLTGKTELKKLSRLVIDVNYKHHLNQLYSPYEEFEKIYQEDVCALPDSRFYAIYDGEGEIIAGVKCQKWNYSTVLAIEKDFMVDLKYFIQGLNFEPREIFHIGRFVIDQDKIRKNKDLQQRRLTILKLLMYHALLPVFKNSSNIFFCECDEKLFSKLNFMGLYPKIIGYPKVYLGSKTIPIYCDYFGIKKFFQTNKNTEYVSKELSLH
jgi:hypothetical protein